MELAQINIACFRRPWNSSFNSDFFVLFELIKAQVRFADGFVWRHDGRGSSATLLDPEFADYDVLINMSVWRDVASLQRFVYQDRDHRRAMERGDKWFFSVKPPLALWWVEPGHRPTIDEGLQRLKLLERNGPSQQAFTFAWYSQNHPA